MSENNNNCCKVCTEKYNFSANGSKTICPFCKFDVCVACVKRYIIELGNGEPKCMNCNKEWTRKQLIDRTSQTFVCKQWKEYKENLWFERECAYIPEVQPYARQILLERELYTLYDEFVENPTRANEIETRIKIIRKEIKTLRKQNNNNSQLNNDESSSSSNEIIVISQCPQQNCKGLITSNNYKCGLCSLQICETCHVQITTDLVKPHVCDVNDIETVKTLINTTRMCPNCPTRIYKIDGCDQMWCTQCHTAFSWKTGKIENGRIHNPHYYEYQRNISATGEIPREPGDDYGENNIVPPLTSLIQHLKSFTNNNNYDQITVNYIYSIHRNIIHILDNANINNLPVNIEYDPNKTRDLRVKYIINDIDKNTFKRRLFSMFKTQEKKFLDRQVLQMYTTTMILYFNDIMNCTQFTDIETIANYMKSLYTYVLKELKEIAITYQQTPLSIV